MTKLPIYNGNDNKSWRDQFCAIRCLTLPHEVALQAVNGVRKLKNGLIGYIIRFFVPVKETSADEDVEWDAQLYRRVEENGLHKLKRQLTMTLI